MRSVMRNLTVSLMALGAVLASPFVVKAQAQNIVFDASGTLEVTGPDAGGLDGAYLRATCTIDVATEPFWDVGTVASYSSGTARVEVTGSFDGAADGVYIGGCNVIIGNQAGYDSAGFSTFFLNPALDYPGPPIADLLVDTFDDTSLQPYSADKVFGYAALDDGRNKYTFAADAVSSFSAYLEVNDPQSAADCKKGGWEAYGFKNQGQCIRFVNTGKDTR